MSIVGSVAAVNDWERFLSLPWIDIKTTRIQRLKPTHVCAAEIIWEAFVDFVYIPCSSTCYSKAKNNEWMEVFPSPEGRTYLSLVSADHTLVLISMLVIIL